MAMGMRQAAALLLAASLLLVADGAVPSRQPRTPLRIRRGVTRAPPHADALLLSSASRYLPRAVSRSQSLSAAVKRLGELVRWSVWHSNHWLWLMDMLHNGPQVLRKILAFCTEVPSLQGAPLAWF